MAVGVARAALAERAADRGEGAADGPGAGVRRLVHDRRGGGADELRREVHRARALDLHAGVRAAAHARAHGLARRAGIRRRITGEDAPGDAGTLEVPVVLL